MVLIEPDLGTAGVIILIGMSMILVVGVRLRSLLILGLMGALAVFFGLGMVLLHYDAPAATDEPEEVA